MLDKEKMIKALVTTMNGKTLLEADKEQFSFPRLFIDDIPVNNVMIVKGSGFPELDYDTGVYVIAYMKNGDRVQYVGRVKMSLENQVNIQIKDDYGTVMEERRRYFKVKADIKCVITGYTRADETLQFQRPIISSIKDLSIGGIFLMKTDQVFSKGDILLISFKVEGELVSVMAEVLRLQTDQEGNLIGYGCRFTNSDQRLEGIFAKFVYNIQLNQRIEKLERENRMKEGLKRVKGNEG